VVEAGWSAGFDVSGLSLLAGALTYLEDRDRYVRGTSADADHAAIERVLAWLAALV
jgi:hypothetical protein